MVDLPDVIPADQFVPDSSPDVIPADKFVADVPGVSDDPEAIADAAQKKADESTSKYGTTGQQLKTFAEHAASSASFGASTGLETKLGIAKPEDIRGRTEENPISAGAGEISGLLVPGAPEAKALGKLGELSGVVRGSGILSKIGRGAVKGAIENAMYGAGNEVSKNFAEDPNQTAQTAIADIELSGLLGGGIGGAFGVASPLFDVVKGNKFVSDVTSRLKEHLSNPDFQTDPVTNLADFHEETNKGDASLFKGHYDETGARTPNVKDQALEKLMPQESSEFLDKSVGETVNKFSDTLENMKADKDTFQPRYTKILEKEATKWKSVIDNPESKPIDIFKATEDMKRNLDGESAYGQQLLKTDPSYPSIQEIRKTADFLRKSLEDTNVWGEAGEFQRVTNKAKSEFYQPLKEFNRSFAGKPGDEYKVDPDKVKSYINQVSKDKGSIRGEKLQNYLEAADNYRSAINAAHEKIGIARPFESTSADTLAGISDKLSPGAKAVDAMVKHLIEHGAGDVAGATGGFFGGFTGAYIGKNIGGPILDSVASKLIKPLLSTTADSAGFKAAADYMNAFSKGETKINRGIKDIFKAGKEVLPSSIPSEKDRTKLDNKLKELQKDQSSMLDVGGKTAHYLPEHGQALSQTAMTAVNFVNSQRPQASKVSPMDTQPKVDPMKKAQFERILNIAQQPLSLLPHIKQGTVQPKDVEAIKSMYPALYSKIASKLVSEVSNRKESDSVIPYKTKMGMSLFLGQAMDSSFLPQAIIAAQPQPAQPSPQQGAKKPTAASAKSMNTVSQSSMTQNQARSAERSRVES
jgi:hypothetical protein